MTLREYWLRRALYWAERDVIDRPDSEYAIMWHRGIVNLLADEQGRAPEQVSVN